MGKKMSGIKAGIDWVACTLPRQTDEAVVLCGTPIDTISNRLGYDTARLFTYGAVVLTNSQRDDMGIHVICSASTLDRQQVEGNLKPIDHIKLMDAAQGRFTRIDLCLDILDSQLEIDDLVNEYDCGNVKTRARTGSTIKNLGEKGQTFYVGRRGSRKLLRVYDKGAQLGLPLDWIRIEIEFRKDAARKIADILLLEPRWETVVAPAIKGFVDFPANRIWQSIIGSEEIEISAPKKHVSKTRAWLLNVCTKSIARLTLEGDESVLVDFLQRASDRIRELQTTDGTDNPSGQKSS